MKLKNVSATQVEVHTACPRAWHFQWVKGFKTPPTEAMQRGTHIHAGAEYAVAQARKLIDTITFDEAAIERVLPQNDYAPYVRSMAPFLSLGQEKVLVEQKIILPTGPGLPPWLGYIDLLDDSRTLSPYLRITDHKTTSDFRYAKTPDELANNIQVVSYARYVFENGHDEDLIQVGHLYVKTAATLPKDTFKHPIKVLPVFTEVDRAQVDRVWARDMAQVEQMVLDAEVTNTDLLPATGTTNGQCKKYGGCPHRERCGLTMQSGFGKPKGTGTMSTDFLKRLQAAKATDPAPAATTAAEAPSAPAAAKPAPAASAAAAALARLGGAGKGTTPAAGAKPATGVLPPDAAPRTTAPKAKTAPAPAPAPEPEDGEDAAEPTGAAEIAAAAQEAPAKKTRAAKPTTAATPRAKGGTVGVEGFALFIDCMPIKNIGGDETTLFEDWINPIRMTLNDEAMKAKNLPDYRLLPYGEEKAMMAIAVNEGLSRSMPSAIIVNSSAGGARDALDVLIPHARMVVRGMRG